MDTIETFFFVFPVYQRTITFDPLDTFETFFVASHVYLRTITFYPMNTIETFFVNSHVYQRTITFDPLDTIETFFAIYHVSQRTIPVEPLGTIETFFIVSYVYLWFHMYDSNLGTGLIFCSRSCWTISLEMAMESFMCVSGDKTRVVDVETFSFSLEKTFFNNMIRSLIYFTYLTS